MADLANRSQLEANFALRMSRLNSRHRKQLLALLGSPPDIERVPESFWKRVQKETDEEATVLLLLIFQASALQHGLPLVGPDAVTDAGQDRDAFRKQMEEDAAAYARARLKTLIPDYVKNSKDALGRAGADWETATAKGDVIRKRDVLDKVTDIFGPERAEKMGVTETTGAGSAGGDAGIEATVGTSTKDLWITAADAKVCPTCKPLDRTTRAKWGRFFPAGPPAHPKCRCYIQYVNTVPAGVTESLQEGFDESKHPRDDHGHFVASGAIKGAIGNPKAIAALQAKVTKPEQRAKLDAALGIKSKVSAKATTKTAPAAPDHHPGAAHGSKVKVAPSKQRAFNGTPAVVKNPLTKQETGRVGEAVTVAYLHSIGLKDARPMNTSQTNFPVDMIEDHAPTEIKAGLASNTRGAQQWRLTFSKEGAKEKAAYEKMSPDQRTAWNQKKQARIHERKQAVLKQIEKETGQKAKPRTITTIINPDTKTADIYVFDGWHDRIDWQSDMAKKAYKGSVKYAHQ